MRFMTYGENLAKRMNDGEFDNGKPNFYGNLGELNEKQRLAVDAFKAEHRMSCSDSPCCNDFGGDISIVSSTNGIGQVHHVICNKCGTIEEITDVDCW